MGAGRLLKLSFYKDHSCFLEDGRSEDSRINRLEAQQEAVIQKRDEVGTWRVQEL